MAKKKATSAQPAAAKSRRKPPHKPAKKPHEHHVHDHVHDDTCEDVEIELGETEESAIKMVLRSKEMRLGLEAEASAALAGAVRKFCRHHGTNLSAAQAHNIALVLFGEE